MPITLSSRPRINGDVDWIDPPIPVEHIDNIAGPHSYSGEFYAMVHQPISLDKAKRIPEAAAALEKEWKKLEDQKAWDISKVREYEEVKAEASAEKGSGSVAGADASDTVVSDDSQ